jgi:hypothetical protein
MAKRVPVSVVADALHGSGAMVQKSLKNQQRRSAAQVENATCAGSSMLAQMTKL